MSHRQRQSRRGRGRTRARGPLSLAIVLTLSAIAIAGLSVVGFVAATAARAPGISESDPIEKGESSVIYAADGSRLGYVQSDEIRTPLTQKQMPQAMRDATVAIEDERFYQHGGVDYEAIVRAGVENVTSGKTVQGGSTITQQLVRALYIKDAQRNFDRKIREAKLASELEEQHAGRAGKDWILTEYLNSVPYGTVNGRTALGVEAAAQTYFSKPARQLTLPESALLAGLPQAPSQYNPFRNPSAAIERRNEVLVKMQEVGDLTEERTTRALQAPLGLKQGNRYTEKREPYFFDYVTEQLIEKYGAGPYRRGGLKVHTTIDPELQEAGRTAINGQLNLPGDPSSAVVAIDPANGYIRAMASSGTYGDRSFNLAAQGHRQPGSAFKTMVLTTAIRKGVDPRSTFYTSKPLTLDIEGYGPWKVQTYDESYGGSMDLVQATLKSDNTVYAQLDVDLGPEEVTETAKLMGITTKLDSVPSEGLGGLRLGVSPLEISNAYATLASGGIRNVPKAIKRVEFPDGTSDDLGKPERKRVFPDGVAYEVTKILEQNVQSGTATKSSVGCPSAGKTGTTDNFNDAWFVGYTPKLATSVWVGYPNALQEMRGVHGIDVAGGTFPAMIWHDFMAVAKGTDCDSFPPPTTPATFTPFYGENATNRRPSASSEVPGTAYGNSSAGGGGYSGYDPRVYAAPPQQPQAPVAPQAPQAPAVPTPTPAPGGGPAPPGGGAPGGAPSPQE